MAVLVVLAFKKMRIKIENVKELAEKKGWKVLTNKYKNLDEEMVFECPEGHEVFAPYRRFRVKQECPRCKDNIFKEMDTKVIPKKKDTVRVLALDQATHTSGWSVYDNHNLIKYGTYTALGAEATERNASVKNWLINMAHNWKPDYIAIEDIQLQQFKKGQSVDSDNVVGIQTFKTLARLQGVLLNTIYELEIKEIVCPTPTWRAHCKVKGSTKVDKKRSMQLLVKKWFDISVSDDEADAIGIGKFASETSHKPVEIISWE